MVLGKISNLAPQMQYIANSLPTYLLNPILNQLIKIEIKFDNNHLLFDCSGKKIKIRYYDAYSFRTFHKVVENNNLGSRKVPVDIFHQPECDAILDIGAYHGEYSVLLGLLNPQAELYCFEPNQYNRKILYNNLSENNLDAIIRPDVVTNKTDNIRFYLEPQQVSESNSTCSPDSGIWKEEKRYSVSISQVIEQYDIDHPFLKIDAEGEGHNILSDLVKNTSPPITVYIELHPNKLDDVTVEDTLSMLRSYDIEPKIVGDPTYPRPSYYLQYR